MRVHQGQSRALDHVVELAQRGVAMQGIDVIKQVLHAPPGVNILIYVIHIFS